MFRIWIFLIITIPAFAQTDPVTEAMRRMEKKAKWPKIEESLRKSLSKDAINPEARYLLSLYFFNTKNPSYHIDSAYVNSTLAKKNFQRTALKDRDRLRRSDIDSLVLQRLSVMIDSAAFEISKKLNNEQAYQHFIDLHSQASQRASAIELRDEVAFLNALKINSYKSFESYIKQYPLSSRKKEAQARYERLLFEDKTKDGKLSGYVKFLNEFPLSPYRAEAERSTLELSTLTGDRKSFEWFIENYPNAESAKQAKNILSHLPPDDDNESDQVKSSYEQTEESNYWVPVIKSGKYGFINSNGIEVMPPIFERIDDDYRCGDVRDRLLVTSAGLISRDGDVIRGGDVKEANEIGIGFWLVRTDSSHFVIHESGFPIGSNVTSAKIIAERFIALENKNKWSLYSLTGKQIVNSIYDDITSIDSLVVMVKSGKKVLITPSQLALTPELSAKRDGSRVFDDVKRWGPQQYWVRNGLLEGVVDAHLNFIIPLDRRQLFKTSFGFITSKDGKVSIKGVSRFENKIYKSVIEQGGWLRLQAGENDFQLFDKILDKVWEGDSVWFRGNVAFVESKDSVNAFLTSGQKISFLANASFQFKEFGDSSAWLVLDDKKRKIVYDASSGMKLFAIDADQLEPVATDIFLVTRAGKKGLVNEAGKMLLPVEFDAIVQVDPAGYSLLKERKFGWFDSKRKIMIKPSFDKNIKSYSSSLMVASRETGYGLLYADGRPLGNFEFEDIQHWTDSVALVKKNQQWVLWNIYSGKIKTGNIRSFTVVNNSPLEKVYIIRQENAFGVISSLRGIVIPVQYSDVINLGSKEIPLYFTERHIEEAGISVVVYFDQHGKIIRKQAMESDEFEKIVCDN